MSVLVVNPRVFEALALKMHYASANRVVNENHYSSCLNLSRSDIEKSVTVWCQFNEMTYTLAYRKHGETYDFLYRFLQFRYSRYPATAIQFLKWLECVRYNINEEAIAEIRELQQEETEALQLLDHLIADVQRAIIHSTPEYDAAKWDCLPEEQLSKP